MPRNQLRSFETRSAIDTILICYLFQKSQVNIMRICIMECDIRCGSHERSIDTAARGTLIAPNHMLVSRHYTCWILTPFLLNGVECGTRPNLKWETHTYMESEAQNNDFSSVFLIWGTSQTSGINENGTAGRDTHLVVGIINLCFKGCKVDRVLIWSKNA